MSKQQHREKDTEESSPGLKKKIAAVLRDTVYPRINAVEDKADDNTESLAELEARLDEQEREIQTLKEMHAAIAGLADGEETTAKKRRRDLLTVLERKAQNRGGLVEMDYNDVLEEWKVLGHGDCDPKQAHRAMKNLADMIVGVTHDKSQRPQVVKVDLGEFDASTAFEAFDNVNNFGEAKGGRNAVSHGD